jgi:hypothetical protein
MLKLDQKGKKWAGTGCPSAGGDGVIFGRLCSNFEHPELKQKSIFRLDSCCPGCFEKKSTV